MVALRVKERAAATLGGFGFDAPRGTLWAMAVNVGMTRNSCRSTGVHRAVHGGVHYLLHQLSPGQTHPTLASGRQSDDSPRH
jgi:hypothetical protein